MYLLTILITIQKVSYHYGYLKNSGRGFRYGTTSVGYRQGGVITRTRYTGWGNMLHNGSNGYYYGRGLGAGTSHINKLTIVLGVLTGDVLRYGWKL